MSVKIESCNSLYDVSIPPGKNFDKAEYRLWIPNEVKTIKGVLVLVSGSNGDARSWVEALGWQKIINRSNKLSVSPTFWQDIARRHGLALLGCYYTDKLHEQMFIEEYVKVDEGSGQALLDALKELAEISGHSELAEAPLAFWGISAGGQFSYEFACWNPQRVITFVLNKGGIYFTALATKTAREVPGIFFVGEKDSPFRNNIIKGIFSVNRRANALWTLVEEPDAVHEIGQSLEVSATYFDEIIPLRLPEFYGGALQTLNLTDGYLGDHSSATYTKYDSKRAKEGPTSWLPNKKIVQIWQESKTKKNL